MRYALSDYLEIYVTKWDELVEEFLRNLSMTSLAVLLALVIGAALLASAWLALVSSFSRTNSGPSTSQLTPLCCSTLT